MLLFPLTTTCKMIKSIKAREILDSRGEPTLEVSMETGEGVFTSSVPSGASKGSYEVGELRDGDGRYKGKGVLKAVESVNDVIAKRLKGKDPSRADYEMLKIGKSALGGNAVLGVSMCACRASAAKEGVPLYKHISSLSREDVSVPRPCFNIVNGGAHAGGGVDFQEFMIVPDKGFFAENLRCGSETYHTLKSELESIYGKSSVNVGDEGGFVPIAKDHKEVLEILGKITDSDIFIDVAAGEFMEDEKYRLGEKLLSEEEIVSIYKEIIDSYNVKGIEDPFGEDSFSGWEKLKQEIGEDVLIIGDDLLATNMQRMRRAKNLCNAMILKINQIGTIKEAIDAASFARDMSWEVVVSHRSGETNDDFIADLAVGLGADYIKSGAPARGERVAKYNRLSLIEKML